MKISVLLILCVISFGCSKGSDKWAEIERKRLERVKIMQPWLDYMDQREEELKALGRYQLVSQTPDFYLFDTATGTLYRKELDYWLVWVPEPSPIPDRPDRIPKP